MRQATEVIIALDPEEIAVFVMSQAEIFIGLEDRVIKKAKSLLGQYTLLVVDKVIADSATELRKRYGWKLPDAFQAALSIHGHITLSTQNKKYFDPIKQFFH